MAHLGYHENEYGTLVSDHRCDACGKVFSVCPAVFPESKSWDNCLAPACPSYDPDRDVDKLFGEDGCLKPGVELKPGPHQGSA